MVKALESDQGLDCCCPGVGGPCCTFGNGQPLDCCCFQVGQTGQVIQEFFPVDHKSCCGFPAGNHPDCEFTDGDCLEINCGGIKNHWGMQVIFCGGCLVVAVPDNACGFPMIWSSAPIPCPCPDPGQVGGGNWAPLVPISGCGVCIPCGPQCASTCSGTPICGAFSFFDCCDPNDPDDDCFVVGTCDKGCYFMTCQCFSTVEICAEQDNCTTLNDVSFNFTIDPPPLCLLCLETIFGDARCIDPADHPALCCYPNCPP